MFFRANAKKHKPTKHVFASNKVFQIQICCINFKQSYNGYDLWAYGETQYI